MINSIIEYLYYVLIFFAPLVMSSATSELFEFNKMILIYGAAILLFFLTALKYLNQKKITIHKNPLNLPILLFLASQIFSTIFSIDKQTSLYGYYGRFNGGLLSIIAYLVLFYGFFEVATVKFIHKLLRVSVISSLLVIFWGLPGKFGFDLSCLVFTGQLGNSCWTDQFRPAERIFSTLGQPNWLGAYLTINFFIGLYFLFSAKKPKEYLFYIYLFLNFVVILFTRSRSAEIYTVAGFLGFVVYFFIARQKIEMKSLVLGVILLLSVLVFKTGIGQVDKYISLDYYKNIFVRSKVVNKVPTPQTATALLAGGVTESFDIRKVVWDGAVKLGVRYPLFGTGLETFAYSYYFVRPQAHNLTSEWDFLYNKAHNEYLNYLATTGFVGLATYLFMIGSVCLIFFKNFKFQITNDKSNLNDKNPNLKSDFLIVSLFLAYVSILATNFFGFSTTTVNIYFYLIPPILLVIAGKIDRQNIDLAKHSHRLLKTLTVLICVVSLYFVFSTVTYYIADIFYAKADTYSRNGQYDKAASLLSTALKLHYDHVYEDKLSFVLANLGYIASAQKQTDIAKQLLSESDRLNLKSISSSPKNVLYWKTRAKNDFLHYQIDLDKKYVEQGIIALKKADTLSPTDPKIPYSLAIYYSLLADEEKNIQAKLLDQQSSLQYVQFAIDEKVNFRDAYLLKAQLLKKYGRWDDARTVFQFILDRFNPQDQEVKKELDEL